MTDASSPIQRRQFLLGTAAAVTSIPMAGCSQQGAETPAAAKSRGDVPLRLLLIGTPTDGEAIQRGWGAVTDQPLDVQTAGLDRANCGSIGQTMLSGAKKADVIIYPLSLVATASLAEVIVELSEEEITTINAENGDLFPAARNAGARFAGKTLALPLGCSLPALISSSDAASAESWELYDQMVAERWKGAAAEPTAKGWAGTMFLWRAKAAKNWLFSRDGFEPLIASKPYVDTLIQMVRTHERYERKWQTPEQVWQAVAGGELKGGIGFPQPRSIAAKEIQISDPPGSGELSKILLDPFSPVISLSANCRQTFVAKRFIRWITGGEGSQNVRMQVPGMNELRRDSSIAGDAVVYDQWLADRLQSPLFIPTLQLQRSGDYYAALDHCVTLALTGDLKPEDALGEALLMWKQLNEDVGMDEQRRTWRRAQGMRS